MNTSNISHYHTYIPKLAFKFIKLLVWVMHYISYQTAITSQSQLSNRQSLWVRVSIISPLLWDYSKAQSGEIIHKHHHTVYPIPCRYDISEFCSQYRQIKYMNWEALYPKHIQTMGNTEKENEPTNKLATVSKRHEIAQHRHYKVFIRDEQHYWIKWMEQNCIISAKSAEGA